MAHSIAFKKSFIDPIQQGAKTQTVRLWRNPPSFEVGESVEARCGWGEGPFARLLVTSIEEKFIHELTDQEAQADGFESRDSLEDFLIKLYGQDTMYTPLYVIGFRQITS